MCLVFLPPLVLATNVTESVTELVNFDLAEILLLAGGAIPAVPFRRCQPVLGYLLWSAAGIQRLSYRVGNIGSNY